MLLLPDAILALALSFEEIIGTFGFVSGLLKSKTAVFGVLSSYLTFLVSVLALLTLFRLLDVFCVSSGSANCFNNLVLNSSARYSDIIPCAYLK